jgi:hypothetical protein
LNRTLSHEESEENQEGGESGSVTIKETRFLGGLAWVKAKALSESGRVSRVMSGYGLGNRVKAFSLSGSNRVSRVRVAGLSGLAWLRSDKAKTPPRAGFSLIPKPGSG